jgi:hypothetical protein
MPVHLSLTGMHLLTTTAPQLSGAAPAAAADRELYDAAFVRLLRWGELVRWVG